MEESASLADVTSVFIPSPTTFATIITKPGGAAMTGVPAWESSIVDYYLTHTEFLWPEPTIIPANNYDGSSSSSNDTSSHKMPLWVTLLLGMGIPILLWIAVVVLVKTLTGKAMKAEYVEVLKTEPDLSWETFKDRWKKRVKETQQREEEQEREATRRGFEEARQRRNERKAAKLEAKIAKLKGKGRVTDGDILLHSMEGQHHEESGRSDFDDSVPPPYSSVVEPGSEVIGRAW